MVQWLTAARAAHPVIYYFFISTVEVAAIWYLRKGFLCVRAWCRARGKRTASRLKTRNKRREKEAFQRN